MAAFKNDSSVIYKEFGSVKLMPCILEITQKVTGHLCIHSEIVPKNLE